MSMFVPGTDWQIRGLADAAQRLADSNGENPDREMEINYARGVEDVLRFLVGDTPPIGTMIDIYEGYLREVAAE